MPANIFSIIQKHTELLQQASQFYSDIEREYRSDTSGRIVYMPMNIIAGTKGYSSKPYHDAAYELGRLYIRYLYAQPEYAKEMNWDIVTELLNEFQTTRFYGQTEEASLTHAELTAMQEASQKFYVIQDKFLDNAKSFVANLKLLADLLQQVNIKKDFTQGQTVYLVRSLVDDLIARYGVTHAHFQNACEKIGLYLANVEEKSEASNKHINLSNFLIMRNKITDVFFYQPRNLFSGKIVLSDEKIVEALKDVLVKNFNTNVLKEICKQFHEANYENELQESIRIAVSNNQWRPNQLWSMAQHDHAVAFAPSMQAVKSNECKKI